MSPFAPQDQSLVRTGTYAWLAHWLAGMLDESFATGITVPQGCVFNGVHVFTYQHFFAHLEIRFVRSKMTLLASISA